MYYNLNKRKMENEVKTTGVVIQLPKDLSLEIDRDLIDLKERNVPMTKVQLIVKYIIAGRDER